MLKRLAFAAVACGVFELGLGAVACSGGSGTASDAGADRGADTTKPDAGGDARGDAAHDARDAAADAEADVPPPGDGAVPYLTELVVTDSADGSGASLVPPFSPTIHDYYVRCAAGTNPLKVTIAASAGSSSLLLLPTPSASLPKQTVSLKVHENDAIEAIATDGLASTEYWVRCLPHDFPQIKMTLHPSAGTPPPGYYLVGNIHTLMGSQGYAMVLDGHGVPVWYNKQTTGLGVCDVDSLVEGGVSFVPTPSGVGDFATLPFELHEIGPTPTTTTGAPVGVVLDLHELQILSNGHWLVVGDPIVPGVDLTGLTANVLGPLGPNMNVGDCKIVEFDPTTGSVVWSWSALAHFDPVAATTFAELDYAVSGPDGGIVIDTFHCNSIEVDPPGDPNGNLLISAREMDSIFYVEKATGNVVWKMGGNPSSRDSTTFVKVTSPFYRQHDARLHGWSQTCNGGSGQISLFDDQTSVAGPARAVVYDVVVGPGDGGAVVDGGCGDAGAPEGGAPPGTAKVAWHYDGAKSVDATGSFRILDDGSRVIGWGTGGAPKLIFTEVDSAGKDLLDFYFEDSNFSYRAVKVPIGAFDLETLRATAGLP